MVVPIIFNSRRKREWRKGGLPYFLGDLFFLWEALMVGVGWLVEEDPKEKVPFGIYFLRENTWSGALHAGSRQWFFLQKRVVIHLLKM